MAPTSRGLHHIAMNVSNLDKSIDFYTRGIGFKPWKSWGDDPAASMLDMGDGSMLELFERPEAAGRPGSLLHIAVRTDDVDTAYKSALAAGAGELTSPRDVDIPSDPPFPVRIAFVTGPDGEEIEFFFERPAG